MQEFLANNTVSWNLMSLTGYRTLVILDALVKSPKNIDEINDYLFHNQYVKEKFSPDTIRLYVNSLRTIGCVITKATKLNNYKFTLISHPFSYDIPKSQLAALSKLYKNCYEKLDVEDLIRLESLFMSLCEHVSNENTKVALANISALKKINKKLLCELTTHCKKKNQIVFLYNSPQSGKKEIEIIADKIKLKSGKLYLYGENLTHREYSYCLVNRIIEISNIKLRKTDEKLREEKVKFEVYDPNYSLDDNEVLISKTSEKVVVEALIKNEFFFIQKILACANNCKILEPEGFREKVINKLRLMERQYEDI